MLRRTLIGCLLVAVCALISATRAKADDVDVFTYDLAGNTFTWQLPVSPTIGSGDYVAGLLFDISDVPFSENGVSQGTGFFDFYNVSDGGGFDLIVGGVTILNEYGEQLYTGPESAPTFLYGTPIDLNDGGPTGPMGSLATTPTPEPSSLLLLAGGLFSFLGLAWKRRIAAQSIS
jgi:PEP-CTERM motif